MIPTDILLEKSLVNCHCLGLDSLVIKGEPGMVRMFIARPDHDLWKNAVASRTEIQHGFSLALHRHRRDTTLMPILGTVVNVGLSTGENYGSTVPLKSFTYTSPILEEDHKGGFVSLDPTAMPVALEMRRIDEPTFFKADRLHSICVPKGMAAAWFVWEGEDSPNYNPTVYSNVDLTEFDFTGMNDPMTITRLREDLEIIGVRG